jgi:hypothetical protein
MFGINLAIELTIVLFKSNISATTFRALPGINPVTITNLKEKNSR